MKVFNIHVEGQYAKNITESGLAGELKKHGLTEEQIERALIVGSVPRSFCNANIDLVWVKRVG